MDLWFVVLILHFIDIILHKIHCQTAERGKWKVIGSIESIDNKIILLTPRTLLKKVGWPIINSNKDIPLPLLINDEAHRMLIPIIPIEHLSSNTQQFCFFELLLNGV